MFKHALTTARRLLPLAALTAALTAAPALLPAGVAAAEQPPTDPTPIGPAVYPGDPILGYFTAPNVNVRLHPWTSSHITAIGQPWHLMGVRCAAVGVAPAGQTDPTWYFVLLHHTEAHHDYSGWVYSHLVGTFPHIPRCGPGV